ncbi:MAG TPA: hypothetical protein VLH18_01590 [Candidatus Limnocylindrales bacterium]|nr:hypothetical protein [Candidatus Limnocylindrales bacterium]
MWHNLRISMKVTIAFLFSIVVLFTLAAFSLSGVLAEDTVQVIVTEATGLQREATVFYATLQPAAIRSFRYFSLAGLGFLLILLYFVDHSYRVFLAPGVLCLVITVFVGLAVFMSTDYIFAYAGQYGEMFLYNAMARLRQISFAMLVIGVVLIAVSSFGDRLLKKA